LPTFKELDKDGDGKVTKEEHPTPQYFDMVDTNKDGSLDPKEFKTAMDQAKKWMANQGGGGPPGGPPPGR
jgi:Ca2+-binding EF-hand superfamily protein